MGVALVLVVFSRTAMGAKVFPIASFWNFPIFKLPPPELNGWEIISAVVLVAM